MPPCRPRPNNSTNLGACRAEAPQDIRSERWQEWGATWVASCQHLAIEYFLGAGPCARCLTKSSQQETNLLTDEKLGKQVNKDGVHSHRQAPLSGDSYLKKLQDLKVQTSHRLAFVLPCSLAQWSPNQLRYREFKDARRNTQICIYRSQAEVRDFQG